MCGIAGLLDPARSGDRDGLGTRVRAMTAALAHRGPDGDGHHVEADAGLALGHRRLAIIDLSPAGAQPMTSQDGRWTITYNGEVYNTDELRRLPELVGINVRGTSDTEVILECVARRGLDRTLDALNGMFAFALWDRAERALHLVRDRLGIKPLFVWRDGPRVAFASELKALFALPEFRPQIEPRAVASFLRFAYVPAPHCIWRDVTKLSPGEVLSISRAGEVTRRRWWSLEEAAARGLADPLDVSDGEATERLEALLRDAVARQMVSDVPLGVFLSGGLDSSTVAALMTVAGRGPVRSFSIGFAADDYDESAHAAAVAAHLDTEHTRLEVTPADALAVVPHLPEMYDEPFADSSAIPTHLVSRLSRREVTVALSGDGGDEVFAGYVRHQFAARAGALFACPAGLRRGAAALVGALPATLVDGAAGLVPGVGRLARPGEKLRKLARAAGGSEADAYLALVSQIERPEAFVAAAEFPPAFAALRGADRGGLLDRMQLWDGATYLPDDCLHKVDRASMAVALEVRPPLLDHRVVELAWRLPTRLRVRDGSTKWLLRQVLARHVPDALMDRPKMGFAVPLADWLRGPLAGWLRDLFDPPRFGGGLLDPAPAGRLLAAHLSGRADHAHALWTLAMFEAWRRRWT